MPTLSVILITRNEEANLRDCLASLGGLAQQVVVVDTASTDGTIAIAQEFGATIAQHLGSFNPYAFALGVVCVIGLDGKARSRVSDTIVTFKRLSQAEIDWYVASGEPRDKAGAYGVQGLAASNEDSKTSSGRYRNIQADPRGNSADFTRATVPKGEKHSRNRPKPGHNRAWQND